MQKHPQLNFVIRNPNGSIQLATQPAVKGLSFIKCDKCEKVHIIRDSKNIRCVQCGYTISTNKCDVPGCKGNI